MHVETEQTAQFTVITVSGEVDLATAPALRDVALPLVDAGRHDLVVDLSRVEFLDSTGLGVLVQLLTRVRAVDGTLRVVAPAERIAKVFRLTGLDQAMGLTDTVPRQ